MLKIICYRGFPYFVGLLCDIVTKHLFKTIFTIETYLRIKCILRLGYYPNILNPLSFNEKLINSKLYSDLSNLSVYADKYEVRSIIKSLGYSNILNELIQVIDDSNQINYNKLPSSFVLKANHGSGMVKIVHDKRKVTQAELSLLSKKWLELHYNKTVGGTDFHYDFIKPKVIVEKLLINKDHSPLMDYKLYCFQGKVLFIDIIDRSKGIPLMFVYDKEWNQLPFALYNKLLKGDYPKPKKLKKMIEIAEDLSSPFNFVRIDLYLIDNEKIIFGEYTFFPGGGMLKFVPRKYDYFYGEKLDLHKSR